MIALELFKGSVADGRPLDAAGLGVDSLDIDKRVRGRVSG